MQIPALIWMLQLLNVAKGPDSTGVLRFKRESGVCVDSAKTNCELL